MSPQIGASAGPVGVVGLGLVGRALAHRLQQAGFVVLGHDHSPQACQAWAADGGGKVVSLGEMSQRCAVMVLAVFDTTGVLQVVEGPEGLLPNEAGSADRAKKAESADSSTTAVKAQQQGAPAVQAHALVQMQVQPHPQPQPQPQPQPLQRAIIDCSTGDPQLLEALAGRMADRDIDFIEAPLSGSSQQIAAGSATMLLGATAAALQRHQAVLNTLSPQRLHVGGAGMGARAKLATNLVLGLNRAALAEGLVFAEALGITPETFLQLVLATPARSDAAVVKGPQMVSGDFRPQSRIRQHLKDLQLMRATAHAAGQRLPLTDTHAALLQAAIDAGDGDLDNAAIVRQLRREKR